MEFATGTGDRADSLSAVINAEAAGPVRLWDRAARLGDPRGHGCTVAFCKTPLTY